MSVSWLKRRDGVSEPRFSAFSLTIHNPSIDESRPTARFPFSWATERGVLENDTALTSFHDIT